VTLVATSGSATTTTPPSVTINPAAFAKLLILAPGETSAPVTASGKTGTPSLQTVAVPFNVTVNAVDEFWNLASSTDTVAITSTDGAATLPASAALALGTGTFAVTFNTIGAGFTVTATDVTDGTKTASTTPGLTSAGTPIVWQGDGLANQWNTTTANWTNAAGTPVTYVNTNSVTFDDTSANPVVDIVGTVSPLSITVNSINNYSLGSVGGGLIGGTLGGLTKQGAGTLTLATANTFSGVTTVTGGLIALSSSLALQNSPLVTAGGSTPKVDPFNDAINPVTLTLGGLSGASGNMTAVIANYFNVTELILNPGSGMTNSYGGVIANGAGGMILKKTGAGTQVLSGASSYTGDTLIQNGRIVISGNNDRLPNTALVTLGDGANSGVLQVGDAGGARNQTVVTLQTSGSGTGNKVVGGSTNNSTLTLNIASSFSLVGGLLGGAGPNENNIGLTKSGNGTLNLSGVNTYAGPTTVSAGSLQLDSANAVPGGIGASGGTSALILGSGVLGLAAGNFTRSVGTNADQVNMSGNPPGFAAFGADRIVNLGGASAQLTWNTNNFMTGGSTLVLGHVNADYTVDFQNPIVLSATRFFRADNGSAIVDGKLSGAITGSTTFSKNGTGTLMISNPGNAWTSTTFVDSGTLMLGSSEVIPNGGGVVIKRANGAGSDGILDLNGFNETIGSLTLGEGNPDNSNYYQAPSVINSSMTPATLTLGGTLTYAAGDADNNFGNGQATISANLNTGNSGTTNRNINVGDSTYISDPSPELLISGVISGGGIITKQGLGTLALSAANTCTADVTVSAGKLVLTGDGSLNNVPTLAVATGTNATLDVSGLYSGALTLAANQTLKSSGANVGPINVTGNLTVGSGRILLALNRTDSPATNDSLVVSGTFTPGGTLTVTNLGPALVQGDSFQLFPGAVSGFSSINLPTNDVANALIYTWNDTLSTDGKITVAAVAQSYDYRSRASGDWTDFNTWSVNKGSGFVNAVSGETPASGNNSVEIMGSHTVTVGSSAISANLRVNTGGTLTVNGLLTVNRLAGQTLANNLTVEGTLNLTTANALALGVNSTNLIASSGVLNHTGAPTVVSYGAGAQLTINGAYVQNITGSGVIPVATWAAASTCRINSTFTNSITTGTAPFPNLNYQQTFGNFIWNAQGGTVNGINFMSGGNASLTNWILQGTLTVENTGTNAARLHFSNANTVLATNKGFFMSGGNFGIANAAAHMTVDGPIALGGGAFDSSGFPGATLTALGDVSFTNTVAVSGGGLAVRFAKTGAQNWTVTTTNSNLSAPSWTVNSGSAVTYGNGSFAIVDDLTVNGSLAISGNSTLLVNGGPTPSSTNLGSITVASGSMLGGDGAIGASITLSSGARMTNNVPGGLLTLTNSLTLNSNTLYVATGSALNPGNYLLITNTSSGIVGSFANVVISGAGLAPNTTSNLVTTASGVTLQVISTVVAPPAITSTVLDGGNLIISGTNATGTAGGAYYVRATNDLTAPIANWPRISTNTYGPGGAFSVTNQILPGVPVNFFRIEQ
jgi:autotransporter-associated beta strand protein